MQTRARGQSPRGVHRYPACSPSLPRPAGSPGPCPHQPSLMLPGGDPAHPEGAQVGPQAKAECLVSHLPARHDPERKACPGPPHRPGGGCRRIYPLSEEGPTGPGARADRGPADRGAGRLCGNRVTIPTSVPSPLLLPESPGEDSLAQERPMQAGEETPAWGHTRAGHSPDSPSPPAAGGSPGRPSSPGASSGCIPRRRASPRGRPRPTGGRPAGRPRGPSRRRGPG